MIYEFDGRRPIIGENAYVSPHAVVIGDVKLGPNCYVGPGAIIRGDYGSIEIGEGTAVEEGVIIHAEPGALNRIGTRVTLGHSAVIHSDEIGDYCVIGMGAVVSIGAVLGKNTIVAEGAIVKQRQSVPDNVVVAGAPAKVVREIRQQDMEKWMHSKQVYVDLAHKLLAGCMKPVE